MGRTFKDKRKFERKYEKHEGLREVSKRDKRSRPREIPSEDFDPYDIIDDNEGYDFNE